MAAKLKRTVITEGDGQHFPKKGQKLKMHYVGNLIGKGGKTGKEFDSSRAKGKPFQFVIGVGQVIQGWDEGVQLMSLGETAILEIPPSMGYGSIKTGPIPADSDLRFEVELLKIDNLAAGWDKRGSGFCSVS